MVLLIVVFFKVRKLQREKNKLETENQQLALNDHHSENIIRNLDREISVQRAINSDKDSMLDTVDGHYRELQAQVEVLQAINEQLQQDLEVATKP